MDTIKCNTKFFQVVKHAFYNKHKTKTFVLNKCTMDKKFVWYEKY